MRWFLVLSGLAFMGWGFVFDPGVTSGTEYGAVLNLGRLMDKVLIFGFGAVQFLAGVGLIGAHAVVAQLRGPPEAQPRAPGDVLPGYTVGPVDRA